MSSSKSTLERALEKAKATGIGLQNHSTERHTQASTETPGDHEASSAKSPLENIVYSQTKSVKIDDKVLVDRRIVAHNCAGDPRADIFRMLRTKVLRQMRNNQWRSLAVTGATPDAGKTFVTVNLAIAIAMELNQTVMVVDVDMRRPRLNWYFDLNVDAGLLDYLEGRVDLKDILVNPGIERLVLIPGRGTTMRSSELLSSPKMTNLVQDIKNRYDSRLIIFDMPPLLPADDALTLLPHIDAALLVFEDGKNTADELKRSEKLLEGTNFIGSVLNKSQRTPDHQHY